MTTVTITNEIVLGEFEITVGYNEGLYLNNEFLSDELILAVGTNEYPNYFFYNINILDYSFFNNGDHTFTINIVAKYEKSLEYSADQVGEIIYIDDMMGNRYSCNLLDIKFIESM